MTTAVAGRRNWTSPGMLSLLALLGLSVFINYVDRGNLSIAAPLLKDELHITAAQLGILLSAFFWSYTALQIVVGWLVDHLDVKWVMAGGFFLWTTATAATGLVHGFATLLLTRLILGVGESVAYPSYSKVIARHFPESHRGMANATIAAGLYLGSAFGIFLGGNLTARFGWRPYFVGFGLVSLLWLIPWIKVMPPAPRNAEKKLKLKPEMKDILRQPSLWGTCVTLFCANYKVYFMLAWMPYYLVRERHYSLQRMARVGAAAYLISAISSTVCGWLSDRWIAKGASVTRVRKTMMIAGNLGEGLFLSLWVATGPGLSVVMLMLAACMFGFSGSNVWAITQILAGPRAAGRWSGVQNFCGNFAGIVAPALTGYIVGRTGHFYWAFGVVAMIAVVGALAWFFLVGPVEEVKWELAEAT